MTSDSLLKTKRISWWQELIKVSDNDTTHEEKLAQIWDLARKIASEEEISRKTRRRGNTARYRSKCHVKKIKNNGRVVRYTEIR